MPLHQPVSSQTTRDVKKYKGIAMTNKYHCINLRALETFKTFKSARNRNDKSTPLRQLVSPRNVQDVQTCLELQWKANACASTCEPWKRSRCSRIHWTAMENHAFASPCEASKRSRCSRMNLTIKFKHTEGWTSNVIAIEGANPPRKRQAALPSK